MSQQDEEKQLFYFFSSDRLEDYLALVLAGIILVTILVFY